MAVVVGISSGRDVNIYTRHGNQPNKGKLALYKPLIHCNSRLNSFSKVTKRSASVIKVGVVDVDVHILSHLKEVLTWAADKRLWAISTVMLFKKVIILRS